MAVTARFNERNSKRKEDMSLPLLALLAGAAWAVHKSGNPKKVFFSFHYADIWRVNQVRNSWVTHPDARAAGFFDASLDEVAKTHGDAAVERLIDDALEDTEVTVVLFGRRTFKRRWVLYEIEQSALRGNRLMGIDISGLRDQRGNTSNAGHSPFSRVDLDEEIGVTLAEYVPEYDWVIEDGYSNFREWVREAPTLKDIVREHKGRYG